MEGEDGVLNATDNSGFWMQGRSKTCRISSTISVTMHCFCCYDYTHSRTKNWQLKNAKIIKVSEIGDTADIYVTWRIYWKKCFYSKFAKVFTKKIICWIVNRSLFLSQLFFKATVATSHMCDTSFLATYTKIDAKSLSFWFARHIRESQPFCTHFLRPTSKLI